MPNKDLQYVESIKLLFLAGLLLFVNTSFAAQNKPKPDLFDLSLEQMLNMQVTVASNVAEKKLLAPANVTVFTKQQLKTLGIDYLHELYNHIPGFYSGFNSGLGNQSVLMTRGHAQKYANTVLFLYNGHRINDDYTGGISYLMRFLNLSNVERIEIVRGPGSAVYGSNAFHGVINIITQTKKHAAIEVGIHGRHQADAGFLIHVNEAWHVELNAALLNDKGSILEGVYDRFGRQNTTQDPHNALQIEFGVHHNDFSYRGMIQHSEREKFYLFRRLFDEHNNLELENVLHQFDYRILESDKLKIKVNGQYRHSHRDSIGVLAPQDDTDFLEDDLLFGVSFHYRSGEIGLDTTYEISPKHQLSGGLNYARSKVPDSVLKSNYNIYGDLEYLERVITFDDPDQRTVLDNTREIASAYAQVNSELTDKSSLTIGARFDDYNDVKGKLNPRIAFVHQLSKQNVFKVLYNEAYRAPSLGDLYDEESGLTQGNDSLAPTSLQSFEMTFNHIRAEGFHSFTLFQNNIDDLIGFTAGNIVRLNNVARSESSGFEYESRLNLASNVVLLTNFTHLFSNKTSYTENSQITPSEALVPDNYGSISANVYINSKWSINSQIDWRDDIKTLSKSGPLTRFNLLVNYEFSQSSELRLKALNVFGEKHATPIAVPLGSIDSTLIQEVPARDTQIQLGWTYYF